MADMAHWDFAEHFRGKEVAELILGIPPEANDGWEFISGPTPTVASKLTPILRRMERALNEAGNQLAEVANSDPNSGILISEFQPLPHALYSETMLRSIHAKSEFGFSLFKDWSTKFDGRFGDAYFTRNEVDRWLNAIGMKSAYQFVKSPNSKQPNLEAQDDVVNEFRQWLIMETWPYEAAMWLLAGVIPREIYEGMGYFTTKLKLLHNDKGEKDEKIFQIGNLTRLWLSNPKNPDRAPPSVFLHWAAQKNIEVDWLESVRDQGYLLAVDATAKEDERPLATTERNTLLKLVIGMAIKGYTYDPTASKNNAPKEIADDLAALGMTITDDTVRKYLKQATDSVLPGKSR